MSNAVSVFCLPLYAWTRFKVELHFNFLGVPVRLISHKIKIALADKATAMENANGL
jgi:hypothetical protein